MQSFIALSKIFEATFNIRHFPTHTVTLYDPAQYILQLGGKRVRPVCVLMGNELFGDIIPDAFNAATAIELFHNFSLIHDDIMTKHPYAGVWKLYTRSMEKQQLCWRVM